MKNTRVVLALLACACSAGARAESEPCRYHEEGVSGAPVTRNSVKLLTVTPPEGGDLTRATVIGVDVEYQVTAFAPETFYLLAMFPTEGYGAMSPGDPGNTPALGHAAGKAHLCVPLEEVYQHPTMHWPLSMRVSLMSMGPDRRGTDAARSREVKFNAIDVPKEALERQAHAPPIEYQDALMKTTSYFGSRAALYKVCIARFPATQPSFTRAYRAWENRHRADIDLVSQAQFETYKEQVKGRVDVAARLADASTDGARKRYDNMPEAELKGQCEGTLSSLAESEDNTNDAVGDEIVMVRKYAPASAGEAP